MRSTIICEDAIQKAKFDSDSRYLLMAIGDECSLNFERNGSNGLACGYKAENGRHVFRLQHGFPVSDIELSDKRDAVCTIGSGRATLWKLSSDDSKAPDDGKIISQVGNEDDPAVASFFSPKSEHWFVLFENGTIEQRKAASGELLDRLMLPPPTVAEKAVVSPDGSLLGVRVTASGENRQIIVLDAAKLKVLSVLSSSAEHDGTVIAFSNDGRLLFENGVVREWSTNLRFASLAPRHDLYYPGSSRQLHLPSASDILFKAQGQIEARWSSAAASHAFTDLAGLAKVYAGASLADHGMIIPVAAESWVAEYKRALIHRDLTSVSAASEEDSISLAKWHENEVGSYKSDSFLIYNGYAAVMHLRMLRNHRALKEEELLSLCNILGALDRWEELTEEIPTTPKGTLGYSIPGKVQLLCLQAKAYAALRKFTQADDCYKEAMGIATQRIGSIEQSEAIQRRLSSYRGVVALASLAFVQAQEHFEMAKELGEVEVALEFELEGPQPFIEYSGSGFQDEWLPIIQELTGSVETQGRTFTKSIEINGILSSVSELQFPHLDELRTSDPLACAFLCSSRLREHRGNVALTTIRAGAFFNLGLKDLALSECERVIEVFPDEPFPLWVKGYILRDRMQFSSAASCFSKCLENPFRDEYRLPAMKQLAETSLALGDLATAATYLEKVAQTGNASPDELLRQILLCAELRNEVLRESSKRRLLLGHEESMPSIWCSFYLETPRGTVPSVSNLQRQLTRWPSERTGFGDTLLIFAWRAALEPKHAPPEEFVATIESHLENATGWRGDLAKAILLSTIDQSSTAVNDLDKRYAEREASDVNELCRNCHSALAATLQFHRHGKRKASQRALARAQSCLEQLSKNARWRALSESSLNSDSKTVEDPVEVMISELECQRLVDRVRIIIKQGG